MRTLIVCLCLAACGGDNGPSADQACADVAQARCNLRSMCTSGVGVTRNYGDMNTCIAREKVNCLDGLGAPSTGNTAMAVEACARVLPTQACSDFFLNNTPPQCLVTGKIAAGGACAFSGQCATTLCLIPDNVACGTCQAQPAAGASCATTGCGRGLSCDNRTMMCVVPGTMGAMCSSSAPCATGFSCVGATATTMGACMPAGTTVGATCDPRARTAAGCEGAIGLYCNAMTMKCAMEAFAAANASCGTSTADGTVTACSASGQCVGATATMLGTCKAPAADGAACDLTNGPPCLAPARCVTGGGTATTGTCQLNDAAMCH